MNPVEKQIEKRREYDRRRYRENPKRRAWALAWRKNHLESARATDRRRNARRSPIEKLKARLKQRYGISVEEYQALLVSQDFACALCGKLDGEKRADWLAVDHDHKTGKVRGLLCVRCNLHLGFVERFLMDPRFYRDAIRYLRSRR